MTAPAVKVVGVSAYERPTKMRMPFRFGVTTATHGRQAFVEARIRLADGREGSGYAAEALGAKWFDKNLALTDAQNQRIAAARGFFIPVTKGASEEVKQPILRLLSENVGRSKYHQLFYDQMLGPAVGAVVNDVSQDLAAGRIQPADAAKKVQQAWKQGN